MSIELYCHSWELFRKIHKVNKIQFDGCVRTISWKNQTTLLVASKVGTHYVPFDN